MKKILKIVSVLSLALVLGLGLAGCGGLAEVDGGTIVHEATITNWYDYNSESYLDTSVNIDFDQIKVEDIKKIEFTIYVENEVAGTAVSEGENLTTLLKDCAQYWDKTAETYTEVTGDRTISCAFKTRLQSEDNGFWVRSASSITSPTIPTQLKVVVETNSTRYTTYKNAVA